MEKTELGGYCEFASRLVDLKIEKNPVDLLRAVDDTAVHTFGWPIAPVLHREETRPKPFQGGIKALIDSNNFDYWVLNKNGNFYFLQNLFEDSRIENSIFFDTRTIRTAEAFYRTGQMYLALGIEPATEIECSIEYGGLNGRILRVGSSRRHLMERTCTGDLAAMTFTGPISSFVEMPPLKEKVYDVINSITQMCDYFEPERAVTDEMVEDYIVHGKIR